MARVVRLATGDDATGVQAIYAPFVADTAVSFEVDVPTVDEIRLRIECALVRWPWLVCDDGGTVAGYAYGSLHSERAAYQWSANVSVYVAASRRRGGVGRALYTALLRLLVQQGFYNAYGGITLPNAASVRLHEGLGFVPVGVYRNVGFKLGAWHDVGWWQLALPAAAGNPSPPRPFPDVRDTPACAAALAAGTVLLRA
jgi:phosphinothricin acetyltransferase